MAGSLDAAVEELADATTFPLLVPKLGDKSPHVRVAAIHALACDRCKDDCPAPAAADVLEPAIGLLRDDSFKHVRAFAVEPMVRKKAGWYAPGGTIFERTRPR